MTSYPRVLGEMDTLDLVVAGRSIARYGDGEFTLAEGRSIVNQPRHPDLCARLKAILNDGAGACLVGIPNILSKTPKAPFWEKYKRCAPLLNERQSYVSSFISRPDSAPWLDTRSYWDRIEALWLGKHVTLVRGTDPKGTGGVSLLADDLTGAASVTEIIAPAVDAWAGYDVLLDQIGTPATALLCLGPTATVMAVDLCAKGVHAIDIGHVGMFRRWHLAGEPMANHPRSARKAVA